MIEESAGYLLVFEGAEVLLVEVMDVPLAVRRTLYVRARFSDETAAFKVHGRLPWFQIGLPGPAS